MELATAVPWVLAGVAVVLLGRAWLRLLERWRVRRRLRRAKRGEKEAVQLLRKHGYRIIALQARKVFGYRVDGMRRTASVRCDILAKRNGKTYVVEVKTGQQAHPGSVSTRRQLMEYARVFRVDSLLLADMDRRSLHQLALEAPDLTLWFPGRFTLGVLLGLGVGVLLAMGSHRELVEAWASKAGFIGVTSVRDGKGTREHGAAHPQALRPPVP